MLPEKIIYIGVLANLIGTIWYLKDIFRGKTKPNLVSWVIWMIAPFVGVFLQLKAGAGLSTWGIFMSGFGPVLVVVTALIKKNAYWKITAFDLFCGALAMISLIIYILTNNLGISIFFAILSDFLAAIPTIKKSWKFPETETGLTFVGGIINNVLALLIIKNWIFPIYAFSAYIVTINIFIAFLIYRKRIANFFKTKTCS